MALHGVALSVSEAGAVLVYLSDAIHISVSAHNIRYIVSVAEAKVMTDFVSQ